MNNLTLLYYSAHTQNPKIEASIRAELPTTYPIVSVTQKPTDLGMNICVGEIGQSHYNAYKQMHIGAHAVKTKYVAMVEDDTLYNQEHFSFRPPTNHFYYNKSMWFLENSKRRKPHSFYWHKWQTGMFACIAPTRLMLEMLTGRFEKYPQETHRRGWQKHYWHEPYKNDRLGLPNYEAKYFETDIPLVTMSYYEGLDGKKKSSAHPPAEADTIPYWGSAEKLWTTLV